MTGTSFAVVFWLKANLEMQHENDSSWQMQNTTVDEHNKGVYVPLFRAEFICSPDGWDRQDLKKNTRQNPV